MTERTNTKEFGAYYTDPAVARFLVKWAIRGSNDFILDPSFGHGVFLEAALEELGCSRKRGSQIFGVEIHPETHSEVTSNFLRTIPSTNLLLSDFFNVRGGPVYSGLETPNLPSFDVVVGNPPFIRYHRWKGKTRKRAQEKALESGVVLNGLSSSWAPFVVYATSFLKNGGNFAMVLPGEILHAAYARPVIEHLWKSFASVSIITFQKKLFSNLSEDVVLVLCDSMNCGPGSIELFDIPDKEALEIPLPRGINTDPILITSDSSRLIEYLLPEEIRVIYNKLKSNPNVFPLGDFADIGIGYVTGNNEYFHLTKEKASTLNIPLEFLSNCVRGGRDLSGIVFTNEDYQRLLEEGRANLLLSLENLEQSIPQEISDYLREGEKLGVHKTYKCRVRNPWYVVPHIQQCDGFLTYMSGKRAKLVINNMGAFATNTLHIVKLLDSTQTSMIELGIGWLSSLTTLSTEIEGHSMGGGMLKLEPREARKVLVALPNLSSKKAELLAYKLDRLIRNNNWSEANHIANEVVLAKGLGMNIRDIEKLQNGAKILRERRYNR